ncbi:MAG: Outer-membrane lipoprotein carrier protein [Alphaproteobacteria bacterium MarineAlpha6_Bin6]|jgi:outer membrane lipoprotein-sorting protein|nr:hypothetical protein [Pelagibacteraceae bacterium]PPR30708.1 MAG: Outer-membrane lipoprotein carrier protein [Alphaproteobacteria bacterium MarineAlpha6_Bin6]PPR33860.1 MAG: Outer-membrane lipoprotein carrier protein [Alphaproteobacteria bacterium MarineAlpha6_Bin5]|tara:strand:- start:556 stop:1137 length:582 start_codon:yes stop_codon:yes gene_type:complete
MKKIFFYFFLIFFFNQKISIALDEKLIKQIENYLNKINNVSSQFIQSSTSGSEEMGKILISKPGKLRIEYKKNKKLLIIADGKWLHYFDTDINEIQSIIIEKSPAWILLKKNINLKKDFNINKLEKKRGKITLTIIDKNIENIDKIELIFSSSPIKLKKWIITDIDETETTVALLNIKKIKKFKPKTFELIEN